ncbi:DUF1294 domain-containing protein [Diaphorobacter sp. HDW4A]|uniref:DUF1294 domain-containing protein n=1 Tax=Diaphorobacter sp. HDW4A TaxID=2714924 RepID=UPI00140CE651|nr:DUF1294 domain-containing protein [Diaphorobacter sp. HDW4A]QIL80557.1 DUF1294 domain-containing protein [Diaphorobacter sp. HDW4A]
MRKQGTIRRWDEERGFGFIDSGDSRDVFVHVRDFARGSASPVAGMQVTYEEIQVGGKGPRAMQVNPIAAAKSPITQPVTHPQAPRGSSPRNVRRNESPQSEPANGTTLVYALMLLWAGLLAYGLISHRIALPVLAMLLVLNLITFGLYAKDKNAAKSGAWRTSESTLHSLALFGGWPAAWFAQQTLRHKTSKAEFRFSYWATVVINLIGTVVLMIEPNLMAFLLKTFMRAAG